MKNKNEYIKEQEDLMIDILTKELNSNQENEDIYNDYWNNETIEENEEENKFINSYLKSIGY